jgi:nucleoside-diphosphate-sugar epimerase
MGADLRGQRVLVSGATGFIGANLVHNLIEKDAQVLGISRGVMSPWRLEDVLPQFELVQVDMTNGERVGGVVREFSPGFILHCAVARPQTHDGVESFSAEANLAGVRNLLEAAALAQPRRCVLLGSSLEYVRKTGPTSEVDRIDPDTEYGMSKAAATQFAQAFAKQTSFPITILRPFSVYGPWEDGNRLIPRAILAALQHGDLALTRAGRRHDFVFVDDVLDAIFACVGATDLADGEIYNVGTGEQWTNEEVVGMIERATGERIPVRQGTFPSREYDRESWVADIRKARSELGWVPRTSFAVGLERTVAWFRANQHRYRK